MPRKSATEPVGEKIVTGTLIQDETVEKTAKVSVEDRRQEVSFVILGIQARKEAIIKKYQAALDAELSPLEELKNKYLAEYEALKAAEDRGA